MDEVIEQVKARNMLTTEEAQVVQRLGGSASVPLIWMFEAVVMQACEDGALGIIRCSCDATVDNGDFFGPTCPGYPACFWGEAVKRKPESWASDDAAQKELVWAKCEEACGVKFVV